MAEQVPMMMRMVVQRMGLRTMGGSKTVLVWKKQPSLNCLEVEVVVVVGERKSGLSRMTMNLLWEGQ
jgi:hypothetical protein